MIHDLHRLVVLNAPMYISITSLVAGLILGVLIYGRRHEQRTRDRGSVP